MKWIAMMVLAAGSAEAADITVVMTGNGLAPNGLIWAAKDQMARIFAGIGVHMEWQVKTPPRDRSSEAATIRVEFAARSPEGLHPGCLAYSRPFGSKAVVTVLYDRFQAATAMRPRLRAALLAHVLAHEIGHILMRTDGHETSGVMKAYWSEADYREMERKPLGFLSVSEAMIRERLGLEVAPLTRPAAITGP